MSRIQARLVPQGVFFGEKSPQLLLSSSKTVAQPEYIYRPVLCFQEFPEQRKSIFFGYMQKSISSCSKRTKILPCTMLSQHVQPGTSGIVSVDLTSIYGACTHGN